MKKLIALLLAGSIFLSACSKQEGKTAPDISPQPSSSAEAPSESVPGDEPESEPEQVVDNDWQFDTPENHGVDSAILTQMHTVLTDAPVYAVVTAKDGVIIDEYYQEDYDETSVYPFHSASKSITGALVGIAIQQGMIGSIDDPLSQYLPQVQEQEDERKYAITLRHLLTQTSGLEWHEWGGGYSNWEEFRSADNWVEYILSQDLIYEPGTVFNYSTGNTHLLAAALENAVGQPLMDYAEENLFGPLGMESVVWGTDPQRIADGGNGVVMTARDAAKIGQLFLNGGVWNGKQIVPADWVEVSTSVQNNGAGDSTGSYGYQWWVREFGGYDTYYAFGAWGQYIFVVPELDLVTVIASEGPQNSYASRIYFTDYVLAACEA